MNRFRRLIRPDASCNRLPIPPGILFVSVTVFLVGFRVVAMIAFPLLAAGAWLAVRKHPKMFELWGLSLSQRSYYDPRKR